MWEFFNQPYPFLKILVVAAFMYLLCHCAKKNYNNRQESESNTGTTAVSVANATNNGVVNEPTEKERKLRAKVLNALLSGQKYDGSAKGKKKSKNAAASDAIDEEKGDMNGAVETNKKHSRRRSSFLSVKSVVDNNDMEDETSNYDTDEENCEDCLICLEEFRSNDTIVSLKEGCNHKFHKSCLLEWAMTKDECPTCRSKMWNADEYTRIEEGLEKKESRTRTRQNIQSNTTTDRTNNDNNDLTTNNNQ